MFLAFFYSSSFNIFETILYDAFLVGLPNVLGCFEEKNYLRSELNF